MTMSVEIKPYNEHVFIGGRTGTGKSFLTRQYLKNYSNVVLLDTKGTEDWENDFPKKDRGDYITVVERLVDLETVDTPRIIYRPVYEELNKDYYEEFFKWIYFRKNTIVWVDEVFSVSDNPHYLPEYYRAILTRGRSRNTAVWSASQRPSGISQLVMSEASHFFVFDLNMPQDREKLSKLTGALELQEKPSINGKKHDFWYYYILEENAWKGRLVKK